MPELLETWLARLEKRHPVSIDLGLDRCRKVWENLGCPRPGKTIFTVAGTNGKGSTVAYIDHLLNAGGLTCGRYTSPHLLHFNERIVVKGREVRSEDLVRAFERVEECLDGTSLTYFEFTTLAAFLLLAEAELDCAVLEVGLGGRLDTVNLIDPDCAVITPVGLDHQAYLGDSIEQITREKAGIMRSGIPVICGDRCPSDVLATHASELGARLIRIGHDFDVLKTQGHDRLRMGESEIPFPVPPLSGDHQQDNLATALAAIETIFPGLLGHEPSIFESLADLRLAGRLMRVDSEQRVLIDVGHNPLAAEVIARHLKSRNLRKVYCVLGMLGDKDAGKVAQILSDRVLRWYCAGLPGPRGRTGVDLANSLRRSLPGVMAAPYPEVADALNAALDDATKEDTVVVFGSFETAARAIRHLSRGKAESSASHTAIS